MAERYLKKICGGWHLRVHATCNDPAFVDLCLIEDKETHSAFTEIRETRNTRLFSFEWNGQLFFHKEFKSPTFGRQLRKRFRPFIQIRTAEMLSRKGLLCPTVFCAGRKGIRLFCVYEGMDSDGDVPEVYQRILEGRETRIAKDDFIKEFGRFSGMMHRARVMHGDYQWGNVLVRFVPGGLRFILIDNDRTSALTGQVYLYRLRNLVQLIYAADSYLKVDWHYFWQGYALAYGKSVRWLPMIERAVWNRVDRRRQASEKASGNHLVRVYSADAQELTFVRAAACRMFSFCREEPGGWPAADSAEFCTLNQGGRAGVAGIEIDGRRCCAKLFYDSRFLIRLRNRLGVSKAKRAFRNGLQLAQRGVSCPEMIGFAVDMTSGYALLLTEWAEQAQQVDAWFETNGLTEKGAEDLGLFLRHMHDAGVTHKDLSLRNLLVQPGRVGGEFLLLDYEDARFFKQVTDDMRVDNLHHLHERIFASVPKKFQRIFLNKYVGPEGDVEAWCSRLEKEVLKKPSKYTTVSAKK